MTSVRTYGCTVPSNSMNFHLLKFCAELFSKDRFDPAFCKIILNKNGELFINTARYSSQSLNR